MKHYYDSYEYDVDVVRHIKQSILDGTNADLADNLKRQIIKYGGKIMNMRVNTTCVYVDWTMGKYHCNSQINLGGTFNSDVTRTAEDIAHFYMKTSNTAKDSQLQKLAKINKGFYDSNNITAKLKKYAQLVYGYYWLSLTDMDTFRLTPNGLHINCEYDDGSEYDEKVIFNENGIWKFYLNDKLYASGNTWNEFLDFVTNDNDSLDGFFSGIDEKDVKTLRD